MQPDPLLGRTLDGGFRIVERIAQGGLSVVYRAEGAEGRQAAVKVLDTLYVDVPPLAKGFAGEAELATQLGDMWPTTLALGLVDGRPFLAMELIAGELLSRRMARAPLLPVEAVQVTRQLLEAIAPAHDRGVVHCDLKPSHIMLLPGGGVKLLDLGLAIGRGATGLRRQRRSEDTFHPLGTPAYTAPELVEPQRGRIDARTDLYAVGVVLFELLTGRRPFVGDPVEVLRAHTLEPAPPVRSLAPLVSAEIAAVTAQALEKEPARRFASAGAMIAALAGTPESHP